MKKLLIAGILAIVLTAGYSYAMMGGGHGGGGMIGGSSHGSHGGDMSGGHGDHGSMGDGTMDSRKPMDMNEKHMDESGAAHDHQKPDTRALENAQQDDNKQEDTMSGPHDHTQ